MKISFKILEKTSVKNFLKTIMLALLLINIDVQAQDLQVGSPAPNVKGINQDGKTVDLAEAYKKNKYVLVYFYPKADTPGCTAQANSLKDSYEVLHGKKGMAIYGVSADEVAVQKDFQKKYNLPFDLIADDKKKVIEAFGVPTNLGFAKRQAYLIKDEKIVWLDKSASTKEQAQDILKYLESEK